MGAIQDAHAAVAAHSFETKEQAQPTGQDIQSTESDWSNNQEETKEATALSDENKQALEEILELDKHEKFRWQGKDWTREDLQRSVMLQSDYTRKSQEVAKMRDFALNFPVDLERVLKQPSLLAEFKRIYPKEFHSHVEEMLTRRDSSPKTQPQNKMEGESQKEQALNNLPPEVLKKLEVIDQLSQRLDDRDRETYQANVEKYKTEVDQIVKTLSEKYRYADPDAVIAAASSIVNQGQQLDQKTWDALFSNSNEFHEKRFKAYQKEAFDKQKTASGKAKDMGTGGQIAGAPPKRMNLAQARDNLEQHIANSQRR